MKKIKTFLVIMASFLMMTSQLIAQAPQGIPYQAVARDASGNLIANQNVSLRFSIHDGSAVGTVVYKETHSITTNNLGLFSINIGQGTAVTGTFSGISWGSGAKFTQVEMDITGGSSYVDMGTTQMMSVPYALYSGSSTTSGYTGGTGIDITGSTITNTAPDQPVTLTGSGATIITGTYPNFTVTSTDNNITYNAGTGIDVTGTTITNTAPDQPVTFTGNGATTVTGTYPNFTVSSTDNNTTYTGGTGINVTGTSITNTAPDQTVTITGTGATTVTGMYPNFMVSSSIPAETDPKVSSSSTNQIPKWNGMALTDGMISDNGTSIGIGTTSPRGLFDIAGNGDIYLSNNTLNSGTQNLYLPGHIFIAPFSGGDISYLQARRSDNSGTTSLRLRTFNSGVLTEAMHIAGNGNVGIGTITPSQKLDVNGTVKSLGFQLTSGSGSGKVLQSDATGNASWVAPSAAITSGTGLSWSGTTLNNTAPDQTITLTGTGATTVTGTYPNFTINSGSSGGTVMSVTGSSPLSSSGGNTPNISLTGIIPVANGGSGTGSPLSAGYMKGGNPMTAVTTIPASDITGTVASATTASNFSGSLAGDISGTQSTTSVDKIKGVNIAATAPANGQVLTYNTGTSQWEPQNAGGSGWGLSGNAGTSSSNFIGTTDGQPLNFKVNNQKAGKIDYATPFNTGMGYQVLNSITTGFYNSALGYQALASTTTAHSNSAFGYQAMYLNTIGFYNTASGRGALYNNTSGSSNTVNGALSLFTNTTGSNNTTSGFQTLYSNTTGNYNIANGTRSLYNNTTGSFNTVNGIEALYSNTAGSNGVAIGTSSQFYVNNTTTAWDNTNTSLGYQSLRGSTNPANNTGINNTALGRDVLLSNTSGGSNTATGYNAMHDNTSGASNTAEGYVALYSNTTGNNNTANGYTALRYNTTGSVNTANGNGALYSNTIGISNTATGAMALFNTTTASDNTAHGYQALYNCTGSSNTSIGYNSGNLITSGSNNITVGNGAQVPTATASNQVRIGNTSITYAGVQVAWTITSDRRWKSDIQESDLGLDFIRKLKPVSYYRNNDESKKREYGFIAQDMEETLNASGATDNGIISKDDQGMYGVRYNDLIAPMVKAIQELERQNKELKAENVKLKSDNTSFRSDIEKIKEQLGIGITTEANSK